MSQNHLKCLHQKTLFGFILGKGLLLLGTPKIDILNKCIHFILHFMQCAVEHVHQFGPDEPFLCPPTALLYNASMHPFTTLLLGIQV